MVATREEDGVLRGRREDVFGEVAGHVIVAQVHGVIPDDDLESRDREGDAGDAFRQPSRRRRNAAPRLLDDENDTEADERRQHHLWQEVEPHEREPRGVIGGIGVRDAEKDQRREG